MLMNNNLLTLSHHYEMTGKTLVTASLILSIMLAALLIFSEVNY
jgi:hypothetical protein